MPRKVRSRLVPLAAATLLLAASAGAVEGANPNRSYEFSACWDGSHVGLEQTWSATNVDEVSFGIANASGEGLAEIYPVARSRSGDETAVIGPPDDGVTASGGLYFHGKLVVLGSIDVPSGGWSNLPAC